MTTGGLRVLGGDFGILARIRERQTTTLAAALLQGAAGFVLASAVLVIMEEQSWAQGFKKPPVAQITPDEAELNDPAALLRADSIVYEPNSDFIVAEGNVEINYQGQVLKADRVTYDQTKDVATADGHVALTTVEGNVIFSDHMVLTDKMRNGIVDKLGMLMIDDSRMAATSGVRGKDRYTVLNKVVYSPCDLCEKKPEKAPLWQLRARRAVHDSETHDITYHSGFVQVFGVPVAYTPYLSMPDPTVKRRTGFLMPSAGTKSDLGTIVTIPYYWTITPSVDVTFSPTFTSQQGVVARGEFRQRTRRGAYLLDGSITRPTSRTDFNTRGEGRDWRGHFFGTGFFTLNNLWTTGFDFQRVSDDTYLRRYGISSLDRLENHAYLRRIDNRDYFITNGYAFQDLRAGDIPGQSPFVLPEITTYNVFQPERLGGRLAVTGNLLSLTRRQGTDIHRFSALADWRREFSTLSGQRWTSWASLRTDAYLTHNVPPPGSPPNTVSATDYGGTTFRALPEVGVEWRYPFARAAGKRTDVVEPIAQVVYAPRGGNPDTIPNDDSAGFEFDDTNLFSDNRFPGYDRWEDGLRVNYGLHATAYWQKGFSIDALVGQSHRFADTSPFPARSGLDTQTSDVLARVTASTKHFSITQRLRFDKDTFNIVKNETQGVIRYGRLSASAAYTKIASGEAAITSTSLSAITFNIAANVTKHWTLQAGAQRDITNRTFVTQSVSLTYSDECARVGVVVVKDFTADRDVRPGTSVLLVLQLANLG